MTGIRVGCRQEERLYGRKEAPVSGSQAWSYPGVPYPTDSLPSGIQTSTTALTPPTPNGNSTHDWVNSYDPCTYIPDQPAEWPSSPSPGSYYIDPNNPASTDNDGTANTYGYPNKPRKTMPTGVATLTLGAGAYVAIMSGTFATGAWLWTVNGTKTAPVYVTGSGGTATLTGDDAGWDFQGSHVIFDNLAISGSRPRLGVGGATASKHYACIRNCSFTGNNGDFGGRCIGFVGNSNADRSEYLVLYNCTVQDIATIPKSSSKDFHFFQPTWWTTYMWVINCTGTRINGDFIQMANTYDQIPMQANGPEYYPHYAWIAGNTASYCGEQLVDCKGSYHVVISSNTSLYQDVNEGTFTANTTAIILSNNAESEHSGPHWAIFNKVFNAEGQGSLIRDSGTCNDEWNVMLGNLLVYGASGTTVDYGGTSPGGINTLTRNRYLDIVCNTVYGVDNGFNIPRSNSFIQISIVGNIFMNCSTNSLWMESSAGSYYLADNCYYNDASSVTITGINFAQAGYSALDELYNQDPLITSPSITYGSDDFSLGAGSPCLNFVSDPKVEEVCQRFQDWYGLDIRQDLIDTIRPQGTQWDCGAYERA